MMQRIKRNRKNVRQGFAIFIIFTVLIVASFLLLGAIEMSGLAVDSGRSFLLETICFQAADGGLERGLAKFRTGSDSAELDYEVKVSERQIVRVKVKILGSDIISNAAVIESGKIKAEKKLVRKNVSRTASGREKAGSFMEGA
ncbi:MAG: hypothetical protein HQM10_08760 [Candidatus Riflebacteria bacterium]|nr:hypothetical protein [Candidatus Riflebacteria bacterium]